MKTELIDYGRGVKFAGKAEEFVATQSPERVKLAIANLRRSAKGLIAHGNPFTRRADEIEAALRAVPK